MNFVTISQKLIGRKYSLGECDCFKLILDYFDLIGIQYPAEFKGATAESYPALYLNSPEAAKQLMVEFIDSVLPTGVLGSAFCGDVLLLQYGDSLPALAVCAGSGQAIVVSINRGAEPISLKYFQIKRVWKCQQQSR